jgi:hypothetical protein
MYIGSAMEHGSSSAFIWVLISIRKLNVPTQWQFGNTHPFDWFNLGWRDKMREGIIVNVSQGSHEDIFSSDKCIHEAGNANDWN